MLYNNFDIQGVVALSTGHLLPGPTGIELLNVTPHHPEEFWAWWDWGVDLRLSLFSKQPTTPRLTRFEMKEDRYVDLERDDWLQLFHKTYQQKPLDLNQDMTPKPRVLNWLHRKLT